MSEAGRYGQDIDPAGVRRLRGRMGLTQSGFAERLRVTPLTVHRWESGQSRPQRLARERLGEIEAALAREEAPQGLADAPAAYTPLALDFAGDPEAVAAVAEAWRLGHGHQFNPAFASETSRIDPLPHQRIAVYERMLPREPLRFLLADDAGAGKTIMTGLYVREALARGRLRRVLVVPPAGLVGNWERELRTLFRLRFRIVSSFDLRADNPFRGAHSDLVIVSLDTLAGADMFGALREAGVPPYDLVVFDEAHKLSASTHNHRSRKSRRYQLAEALAGGAAPSERFAGLGWSARHLLLLTATPHMGKESPYHHLWRLLDAQVFQAPEALHAFPQASRAHHFIRRTKEEMVALDGSPLYRRRLCDTFSYDLTQGEQELYDLTTAYLRRGYDRAFKQRPAVQLAMSVFQRRLASSTWALLCSFQRRIAKLKDHIDDLRSGKTSAADLRRLQGGLDRRGDFFDSHGADDDDGEHGEAYEVAILGAALAVTAEELEKEIATLEELRARARQLLGQGWESKFEKLRGVLEDPQHGGETWLIFSEHRDTVDYLVRRLEGLGYSGQVARIHGGMEWPERERQVEHFRRPSGARYLVATDAAGEGINLQFCRSMVNYDIPWNPARLEQRMGRIHRYGQKQDVRIVNLVAGGTHEGRVLKVLLEKLDAIRREFHSDKVFDVVGRLFENASLRDYMMEALTGDGERRVVRRVEEAVSGGRLRAIEERERRIYGGGGEIAPHLDKLRRAMEREGYLRLLPGYVRRFVAKAAALLQLEIRGDLDGFFSLVPRQPGALDPLLAALESYPGAARERLCVRRPDTISAIPEASGPGAEDAPEDAPRDSPYIWLHPGEPLFEALSGRVLAAFARAAERGAIFTDPRATAPYLFHLAMASVEREEASPAPAASSAMELLPAPSPIAEAEAPGAHRTLERRLFALRHDQDGSPAEADVEQLLLLRGAPQIPPGAVPLAARGPAMRAEAAEFAERRILDAMVAAQRIVRRAELPERRRRVGVGFDLAAADLASRRAKLARAAGAEAEAALAAVKREQRALDDEKARALAALDRTPDLIAPGGLRFLAHALVVPVSDPEELARYDTRVEEIAVRIASAWERDRGGVVRDVSRPELARLAGVSDWPGFDLLSRHGDGEQRCIEVKGRAGSGAVQMEVNEWQRACNQGACYWLYIVLDCATPNPQLLRVQDPFAKLLADRRDSSTYTISVAELRRVAER